MFESTRRQFMTTSLLVIPAVGLIAACTKKNDIAAGANCVDVSSLTGEEKAARAGLKYVDKSEVAGNSCDNCQLYVAAKAGAACGTCQIIKGPINPKGHCVSWVKKMG